MCGKVFIKRVLPFFLTFAVGLFIASFFVSIAAPKFQFKRGVRKHNQYHRMMEFENQRLSEENSRLKRQLADLDAQNLTEREAMDFAVPPPPPLPPAKAQTIPFHTR